MRSALLEQGIHEVSTAGAGDTWGQHCWSRGYMRSALLEQGIHEVSTAGAGDT